MTAENKWAAWEEWIETHRPPRPELKYNPKYKRTKGVQKRIKSFLRRNKSFLLHTISVEDNQTEETWLVGSGGWVSRLNKSTGVYKGTYGHIKNLLQFLGGPQPMWYDPDRPEKRSYVRRKVHRGKV